MRSEPKSTLRFYLTIIRRRRWAVLIGFVVPVAIAAALTVTAKKMYGGSAFVVINRQTLADQITNAPSGATTDFLNIVQTYADSARSTQVADEVVRKLPGAHLSGKQLLSQSAVTPSKNSDVLSFTVDNGDPRLAQRLATAYATAFVNYQEQQRTSSIGGALSQIDARLQQAKKNHNLTLVGPLTARDQQLRTLQALQIANSSVYNSSVNASQVSPKVATNGALGIVAGIVLAALLAALLEALDTRVREAAEVESILGLPLLGRIGPPPKGFENRVVSLLEPANVHAEGFRILRTSLELQTMEQEAKVFLVSGPIEAEGKSLTLANLAVTAARAGRKVILVDLDLRRPTQDIRFGCEGRVPGVSDVLLGEVPLEDALIDIPLPGGNSEGQRRGSLRLLRSGTVPLYPADLVAGPAVGNLLDRLRSEADVVYVDSPPILRAGDALTLSGLCDAMFLVVRIPQVRRPMLIELARLLEACPIPITGFVCTGEPGQEYGYGPPGRSATSDRRQAPSVVSATDVQPSTLPVSVAVAADEVTPSHVSEAEQPEAEEAEADQEGHAHAEEEAPSAEDPPASEDGAAEAHANDRAPSSGPDRAVVTEFLRSRRAKRTE